ncbi:MAG: AAA family ATPase [Candidatus Falkowbacteria bacterium]
MDQTPKINWSFCSSCQGEGRQFDKPCPVCHGLGVALVAGERLVFFDLPLSRASIYLRRARAKAFNLLDFLALLVGAVGLAALGWWVIYFSGADNTVTTFFGFLTAKHPLLFTFWLSVLVDLFVIYRFSRRAAQDHKFKKRDWLPEDAQFGPEIEWQEAWKAKRKINAADFLSEPLLSSLELAYLQAVKSQQIVAATHLFVALVSGSIQVANWMSRLEVNGQELLAKIGRHIAELPTGSGAGEYSRGLKQVVLGAWLNAAWDDRLAIEPMDTILGIYESDSQLAEILFDSSIDKEKLINLAEWFNISERILRNYKIFSHMARFKPGTGMDRAYTALATPLLDSIGIDLTVQAKFGRLPICVGRDTELNSILTAMASGQPGILLVGPTGAGKHAMIEGLAQQMVMEKVPPAFQDKRLVEVDIARLLGGAAGAEAENRLMEIINEVGHARNVILYFPDIEKLTGITAGSEGSLDLAGILVSALENGQIYCLASASEEAFRAYVEGTSIAQAMAKIAVLEPEPNTAIQMVQSKVAWLEHQYGTYFSYESLAQAVVLTARFDHTNYLPEKAIKLLERVAPMVVQQKGANSPLTADDVADFVSKELKVPVNKVSQQEGQELLALEEKMHGRMVGQEEAVKMVAESLRRARAELREGKRPIASFLFLGPTGVGKTELAKTLAATYFGDEQTMIRLDMSEYQSEDALVKMIGSAEGVAGYLTEKVRKLPFALVLLDEIEKANARVLDLFLQVMDDGRLTDGQGRTIDFTNVIIIATSNIGAVLIKQAVEQGVDLETIKQNLLDTELIKYLRPEFVNRFDGVIVFKPLNLDNVTQIAGMLIAHLAKLLEAKGIILESTDAGLRKLAAAGFHPEFGARPLRRLLQDRIENVIAKMILSGDVARRDHLLINDSGEVVVEKARKL